MFEKPILFIIFNRIETTKVVFNRIREIQPKQLFIAADGPRNDVEKAKCVDVRNYVLSNIDWECDVKAHFLEYNKGCGHNVSEAITWFFDNVESGIILEDDCLPQTCFFEYCSFLLDYYKDDEQIMHITGYNPLGVTDIPESVYFANIIHCWGWASWRRAWKNYRFDIDTDYKKELKRISLFNNFFVKKYWFNIFNMMLKHKIDTWDYQWAYNVLKHHGLCIIPSKNLVKNVGMTSGTHYEGCEPIEIFVYDISFPLILPKKRKTNKKLQLLIQSKEFKINKSFFDFLIKKTKYLLFK